MGLVADVAARSATRELIARADRAAGALENVATKVAAWDGQAPPAPPFLKTVAERREFAQGTHGALVSNERALENVAYYNQLSRDSWRATSAIEGVGNASSHAADDIERVLKLDTGDVAQRFLETARVAARDASAKAFATSPHSYMKQVPDMLAHSRRSVEEAQHAVNSSLADAFAHDAKIHELTRATGKAERAVSGSVSVAVPSSARERFERGASAFAEVSDDLGNISSDATAARLAVQLKAAAADMRASADAARDQMPGWSRASKVTVAGGATLVAAGAGGGAVLATR